MIQSIFVYNFLKNNKRVIKELIDSYNIYTKKILISK